MVERVRASLLSCMPQCQTDCIDSWEYPPQLSSLGQMPLPPAVPPSRERQVPPPPPPPLTCASCLRASAAAAG